MRGFAAIVVVLGFVAGPGAASALAFNCDVSPANVPEGDAITVSVTRDLFDPVTATVTITTGAPGDTASKPADYTEAQPATLNWVLGSPATQTATIQTVEDTLDEPNERLTIACSTGGSAYFTITRDIVDDDAPPTVTIGNVSAAEGTGTTPTTFSFPVTLSTASARDITVNYATANGTATAGQDYTAATGSLMIPKGTTTAKIDVLVTADDAVEPNENFTVALTLPDPGDPPDPKVALGTASTGTGTITNDDFPPTLSITAPAPKEEGSSGLTTPFDFVIKLSRAVATPVTVVYSTADGAATAPADYTVADEAQVIFAPGEISKTVSIAVRADTEIEQNEDFSVSMSNLSGIAQTSGSASAIIVDDDAPKPAAPPAPPAPPVVTRDLVPPAITLSKVTSSRGVIRVTVTCPAGEQRCRGTVTVFSVPARKSKVKSLRREVKLGSSLFVLTGGEKAKLTLRPSKRVARLIRQARTVKARAYAVARDAAGNVGTAQSKGTVRAR